MEHDPGATERYVAVFDTETDSLVDSIPAPFTTGPALVASPDGRFLCVLAGSEPARVLDAATGQVIRILLEPTNLAVFLPDTGLLVCPRRDSALVYAAPAFDLVDVWQDSPGIPQLIRGTTLVIGIRTPAEGEGVSWFLTVDYTTGVKVEEFQIPAETGFGFYYITRYDVSPNGSTLYATGSDGIKPYLIAYSLGSHETLFAREIPASFASCRVSPDAKEVWVASFGSPLSDPPQEVLVFDAMTGTEKASVDLSGLSGSTGITIQAVDLRFVPTTQKVYVLCGSVFYGRQPILVVNAATREIVGMIYGDFRHLSYMIDVAPFP